MSTEDLTRRLSAILSADVEGYSRLMQDDEEATVRTITTYRTAMTHLIQQYRGRVVDSPGDNILAEFTSVVDAVNCGVEIQRELAERNAELPENRRMRFRVGINLGDVLEEGERIYGDGVNIAARMESLAEAGEICISGTVYDAVESKIGLEYEYLGEHEVKNIDKPVRTYRVLSFPGAAAHRVIKAKRALGRSWRNTIIAIGIAVIVGAGLAVWQFYLRAPPIEPASEERMAFPLPDKPSIAVLPFVNMSDDPKQEYFSDGLTEEIISALSKVPKLFVIARNSTFTYKGKPVKVQQVSEELGVRYVLEGSVRKAEDRVRITAQLIDALSGHHLWSERYDRDLEDIFALQDEITMKIITALQVKLTEGEQARLWSKGTQNLKANLKFLQAHEYALRQTKEGNILARRLASEAIEMDSKYADPHYILAFTHMMDVWLQTTKTPEESIKQSIELSKKAIALDDSHAQAYGLLGTLYTFTRQHDRGVAMAERGVALEPNGSFVHGCLGYTLRYAGRFEEAIQVYEKAIRLNPFPNSVGWRGLCIANIMTGRYEEAIAACKGAVAISPNDYLSHGTLAAAYSLAGQQEQAYIETEKALNINPKASVELFKKTLPYKTKTDLDRHVAALRKAGIPETPPFPLPDKPSIAVLPFENMSGDSEQEYFSDGITEQIITALSRVPKLFVIARNSAFSYKGKHIKVQQVGRELGVRYILEGSIQRYVDYGVDADKSGPMPMKKLDSVRITAQLVDAAKGQNIWAERYDRELKDIFAIQDQITMKIISALQVKLTRGEQSRLYAKGTDNLEAYLKTLKWYEYFHHMNRESNISARRLAEEAIALDPKYPVPYVLLGWNHYYDIWIRATKSPRQSLELAFELAQKALALDETTASAHMLLANVHLMRRQHDKALAEMERALELEPNAANLNTNMGRILMYCGRPNEAITRLKRALRLSPIPEAQPLYLLGITYNITGQYEEAIELGRKAMAIESENLWCHAALTCAYSLSGREEEACSQAKEMLRINPNFTVDYFARIAPYKNEADTQIFVNAFRTAGLK